ncbi:hypothetical protein HNP24_000092 [Chryseobacterium sediminis]|uniref:Uncharacterized protein n=1 Tax=Chryseobacterium sediminis TaxID=1679494 RepID=A0ABR6PTY8_9FLAO|nr:hypothetical protein [Chryseobacterium sediminis]MBB6329142.1 hypothetical protein [Chryseobacterium sediminis]
MKNLILSAALLSSMLTFSQVGVDTTNPQAKLHVDGAKDNPVTGVPTTTQQLNDFAVTSDGNVGIGITAPTAPLTFPRVTGRKISLYNTIITPPNDHQYNGFGMEVGSLINQASSTAGKFVWRAGTSSTTSNSLMLLTGTGNLGLGTINPANMLTVNGGKIQYTDGTEGDANILTSDANGVASWKPASLSRNYATLSATGVSVPSNATDLYTGTFVDIPAGKWQVSVAMLMSKGSGGLTFTAANESWWVRTSFSDSSTTLAISPDIISTSNKFSGLLPPVSPYNILNGAIIINNTSGATKRYYYYVQYISSSNATGNLAFFGSSAWGEDSIIYERVN